MENIVLNNGVKMPQVGLGTFLIPKDQIERTIIEAYDMGYRQFDTAWRYYNEADIYRALKRHGVNREDVFLTTKVNIDALYRGACRYSLKKAINYLTIAPIRKAVEESFKNLNTDYIDLFLIHSPWSMFMNMWRVLEEYYKAGRIRAIGVSSFLPPHLEALAEISDVVPAINQFEISPLNTQKELIQYCKERGIAVEAMSTFSHFRSNEPRKEIIDNELLKTISLKYNKSVVQVVLRWLVQQGIIVIPKTWNPDHLKENIDIYDFTLTVEEIHSIDSLNTNKFLNYNPYTHQKGLPKKYLKWEGFRDMANFPDGYKEVPKWRKMLPF